MVELSPGAREEAESQQLKMNYWRSTVLLQRRSGSDRRLYGLDYCREDDTEEGYRGRTLVICSHFHSAVWNKVETNILTLATVYNCWFWILQCETSNQNIFFTVGKSIED